VLSNLAIEHPVHVDMLNLDGTSGGLNADEHPAIDRQVRHAPVCAAVSASDDDPLTFRDRVQNHQPSIGEISFNLSEHHPHASTPYLSPVILAVLSEVAGCGVEVAPIERVVRLFDYAPVSLGNVQGMYSIAAREGFPTPSRSATGQAF
jgi:hypothetical protein